WKDLRPELVVEAAERHAALAADAGVAEEHIERHAAQRSRKRCDLVRIRDVGDMALDAGRQLGARAAHRADDAPALGRVLPAELEAEAASRTADENGAQASTRPTAKPS